MIGYAMLALAGAAAAMPQAVTSAIAPSASAPAGCSANYPGTFEISVVNVTNTASKKRAAVTISLANGVMTDSEGRTGYIAANNQFQFDGPVQAGAIYTAGWSVCGNNTLALGGSAIFYECLSGTFYNLYDESTGAQCSAIYIDVIGTGSGSAVSSAADGQATAGSATVAATQLSDGQIQATTATAVSQISDGQIQATTATAVSQISDGQIQATTGTAKPVTQISDGQIQATTAAVVSQISDGQIQATTAPVVSQISDGQIQATTAAVVSQISDGQIQATTATAKPVSQISDGQIQAATNGSSIATASPTVAKYTGGASLPTARAEIFGLAAGVLAMAMF